MSLLAPLYLAGIAALSLPLLFHLIRRTPRGRVAFSSLMFLRATPPRLVKRSRLDNVALLCLRALILLLLAGAFARPFLRTDAQVDPNDGEGPRVAILVDTSASMRRPGVWDDARREVERALDEQPPTAEVTLSAFDRGLRRLVPFDAEGDARVLARETMDELEPGWAATDLGNALVDLADELHARGEREATIVLVSDMQAGSARGALEERDWPAGVRVEVRPVRARGGNASLHLLPRDAARGDADELPWVRVANDAEAEVEELRLRWTDGEQRSEAKTVFCPRGESRVVRAPARPADAAFDRLVLEGDDAPFDDVLFDRVAAPRPYEALTLNGAELDELLTFVFADAPLSLARTATWPDVGVDVEATPLVVWRVAVDPAPVEALFEHARQGGAVLAVVSEGGGREASLRALLDEPGLTLAEAEVERGYALLGAVELAHPLFTPFDDPRFSDFTKIRFWRRRAVSLPESSSLAVLARFDDGDPFLVERRVGEGRVLVMTSSWLSSDSDLARSTKFAPLLHGMLRLGRRPDPALAHIHVGDAVPLPRAEAGEERAVVTPDGERLVLAADADVFLATDQPGFYELQRGERASGFTVRLDPAESRTDALEGDPLAQAGVTVVTAGARAAQEDAARQRNAAELEQGQQGWRWLILAALAMLLLETVWAGRLARHTRAAAAGP